jgi:hypothetical protein
MDLRCLPFTLLFCAFVPSPTPAAVVLDDVPVRVYDPAASNDRVRRHALETASATLAAAGVMVTWLPCDGPTPAAACGRRLDAGELVLRIVSAQRPGTPRGAASLRAGASMLPLGDAFVDLGTQSGVLATVYVDRVAALGDAAGMNLATLLGYAIAHEIGHLLLGTSAHGTRGLMRPLWSRDELRRGRRADWLFTETEVNAIRARRAAARAGYDRVECATCSGSTQPPPRRELR